MADGTVQVAPDSTGKKVDTSEVVVGANTVERQRIIVADSVDAAGLAKVQNATPGATDYGLTVRGLIEGDVASGAADAGLPVKVGGLAKSGLPVAVTDAQRVAALFDLYGRQRTLVERPKLLGSYKFEAGRLAVLASAHSSTAGFFWLINPVGSGIVVYVKKLFATCFPVAASAFTSSPRITVERVTFTGTASGATVTPAKRDSNDAANVATIRTASTGLTLTAGAVIADFSVPAVLTAVGIVVPVDQWFYDATDEDDYIVLRAGEGLVVRQPDAGSTSDTRIALVFGSWEER